MSDHIDGPRTTADPSVDLSDLYVFTSPSDPRRTVLIANVFPSAGETALFSNVANYAIVMRRVDIAGTGTATSFRAEDTEFRFTFKFEVLKPSPDGKRQSQTGVCQMPGGAAIDIIVNDENGATIPDGKVRAFAGLRSDPFYIGWRLGTELTSVPNYLEEDNVLSLVVEFETEFMFRKEGGTLYGVIAETTSRDPSPEQILPVRFDWVGKPEQTNLRLNGIPNVTDLRDLWNQETPFAIGRETLPIYRERLTKSLEIWDTRDGRLDWEPQELAANVNMFLDDFLLFDIAKPISDHSHLEIEKSTVDGRSYETGGGRTLEANAVDILVTWLVNHDRGPFMQGGAMKATQTSLRSFPYVPPPNTSLLTISNQVDLAATPQDVWRTVGKFGDLSWHPLVASVETTGVGIGKLRSIDTIDGKTIVERLTKFHDATRTMTYALVSGIPASPYVGSLEVTPIGTGSRVVWHVSYRPDGLAELFVHAAISQLLRAGMRALETRFGRAP